MLNNRNFWLVQMLFCALVYIAALVLVFQGQTAHLVVKLAALLLIAHILEMPLAFKKLKDKNPQPLRVIVATLFFGLLWWVPASRGIFAVR